MVSRDFVDLLMTAPVGVALLHALEGEQRSDSIGFSQFAHSRSEAVAAALEAVATMSIADILDVALTAADAIAGPWNPLALTVLPEAYRAVQSRRELAGVVADRLESDLGRDLDRAGQEWWHASAASEATDLRYVRDVGATYCCGEFPFTGIWTVTSTDDDLHEAMCAAWELWGPQIRRWRVGVTDEARVVEIHGPDDWIDLVGAYPAPAARPHGGWELPCGRNENVFDASEVIATSNGAAARRDVAVVMPDWQRVAEDWDGVHVSWRGMLTCEGHVLDVPHVPDCGPDTVTMLRYWGSERTRWFRSSCFGETSGLSAPELGSSWQGSPMSTLDGPELSVLDWPI